MNLWSPPPDISIAEWADYFRVISPEASAEIGRWHTDRAPYQREIMNAISDDSIERVIMMSAAQVGKSEIILNTIGYYVDKEPSPILLLQPTLEMGEAFSKDRLAPMIRDTPCLTGKIKDPRARDSGNTLLHKRFAGGHITIAGANSPAGLASRPIRILLCDEVDRYPVSAGTEGDPLNLAQKRTQNFWNRKILFVSTPTLLGVSRIAKEYDLSSKEEWTLPCPECKQYNALDFENIRFKDVREPVMKCNYCGREFGELEWKRNQLLGKWRINNPDITRVRGFHLNAFASPWASWTKLCTDYQEAKINGEENLKVWTNTVLGLPYESKSGTLDSEILENRREKYNAELPDGVLVLTAGVDVQDDRLECEIVGWGLGHESWGICYKTIYGDPSLNETWLLLDDFLCKAWHFKDGRALLLSCVCIDSGGHFTDEVYIYTKPRSKRNIFAIIGRGGYGRPSVAGPTRNNRRKVPLFTLGVSTIKGVLQSRLMTEKPGAGFCHFPDDKDSGYDTRYFAGLVSERMITKRIRGREQIVWEVRNKNVRNEPLDCRVYATGALEIFNPDLAKHAARMAGIHIPENKKETSQVLKRKTSPRVKLLRSGVRM